MSTPLGDFPARWHWSWVRVLQPKIIIMTCWYVMTASWRAVTAPVSDSSRAASEASSAGVPREARKTLSAGTLPGAASAWTR